MNVPKKLAIALGLLCLSTSALEYQKTIPTMVSSLVIAAPPKNLRLAREPELSIAIDYFAEPTVPPVSFLPRPAPMVLPQLKTAVTKPVTLYDRVSRAAKAAGVPTFLAHDIIKHESRYDTKAFNDGAYGLGQIKCGTARGVGFKGKCRELFDPDINLEYSMRYLRKAMDKANGDFCHAATLYNRGFNTKAKHSNYCKALIETMGVLPISPTLEKQLTDDLKPARVKR